MCGCNIKGFLTSRSYTEEYSNFTDSFLFDYNYSFSKPKALVVIVLSTINIGICTAFFSVEAIVRLALNYLTAILIGSRFEKLNIFLKDSTHHNFYLLTCTFSRGIRTISTALRTLGCCKKAPRNEPLVSSSGGDSSERGEMRRHRPERNQIRLQQRRMSAAREEETKDEPDGRLDGTDGFAYSRTIGRNSGLTSPIVYDVPTPSDDDEERTASTPYPPPSPRLQSPQSSPPLSKPLFPTQQPMQNQGYSRYSNR